MLSAPKRSEVVRIEWKLPARLRRPIHTELARQRRLRARQEDKVSFTRRPLITRIAGQSPKSTTRPSLLQLPPPPYIGQAAVPPLTLRSDAPGRRPAATKRTSQPPRLLQKQLVKRPNVRSPHKPALEQDEWAWQPRPSTRAAGISLPVHMSLAPPEAGPKVFARLKKLFKRSDSTSATPQLMLFLVSCALLAGLVWQLQAAGRGLAVLGVVSERAHKGYQSLNLAEAALAAADFPASQNAFRDAEQELSAARQELDTALSSSRFLLEKLDVTGTVRSGTAVLETGEAVTRAGRHLTTGVSLLVNAKLWEEQSQSKSLVDALREARPELAAAQEALALSQKSAAQVERDQLPPQFQSEWETLINVLPRARLALDHFLEQSDLLFALLGADAQRQYLLVFENNHELRPTGGFVGSLGLINVDRGIVENIDVQSVYDPDGQLKEFIAPPSPLSAVAPRWWLRDANWFVDYKLSAQKMASFFEKSGGPTVDGVIALTPEVVRSLLEVTGPIDMPSYGLTVDASNFIPLTQDQVTYHYDREQNRPKQFLADLTPALLNKLFSAPSATTWNSLSALLQTLQEKDLLLYFRNPALQEKIEQLGWGGRLPPPGAPLLSVNNANIGGHKSDQFIEQEIDYRLEAGSAGGLEAVLTIRRTHNGPGEALPYSYPPGEDPATRANIVWQRVFVPSGAALLDAQGFSSASDVPRQETELNLPLTADPHVAEWEQQQQRHPTGTIIGHESGYTYFANWMITPPGATSVGLYRFRLPEGLPLPSLVNVYEHYGLRIVKQPGDARTSVRIDITLPESLRVSQVVPEEGMTLSEHSLVYRGALRQDKLIGLVYEKQ